MITAVRRARRGDVPDWGVATKRIEGKGETTIGIAFLHDSVAQTVQGYPIKTVAPCEGSTARAVKKYMAAVQKWTRKLWNP